MAKKQHKTVASSEKCYVFPSLYVRNFQLPKDKRERHHFQQHLRLTARSSLTPCARCRQHYFCFLVSPSVRLSAFTSAGISFPEKFFLLTCKGFQTLYYSVVLLHCTRLLHFKITTTASPSTSLPFSFFVVAARFPWIWLFPPLSLISVALSQKCIAVAV